ncbi:PepSY-associated TM helix domain-containing protein [Chryseobacterium sp. CT-SW4]|uniref:PepSY-associated TM helix domain-containing protein n=1 Tax=Chryseobacterium sp. SW-1 TaxID=3157343 RepID=UPI003B02757A
MNKKHHKKKISPLKKWVGKLHLYLGLSVGLIVFIISLTGTLYVFKDEVQQLLRKEVIYIKNPNGVPLSIDILKKKVSSEVQEKYPLASVDIPLNKYKSYKFLYYEKNKGAWNYFEEVLVNKTVYINQYTGKILGVYNEKYDFFNLIKYIHWSLLLNSDWGKYVVGIPVIIFIFMLVSGIILWWPKNKKTKGSFWFKWKNIQNWKRKNYDLHRILGFYSSFIALLISITGIYFSYPYVKNTFNLILSGSWELPKDKEFGSVKSNSSTGNHVYDMASQKTKELYGNSSSFRIPLNGKNKKGKALQNLPIIVYQQEGKLNIRNQLVFDKYSSKLLYNLPHQDLNNAQKYAHANYDIHTGSYFGVIGKIIWFITGLICTSLPITGFLFWWGKQKKPSKKK